MKTKIPITGQKAHFLIPTPPVMTINTLTPLFQWPKIMKEESGSISAQAGSGVCWIVKRII
jgi:hypothetical protein